jgi:hypothetical protein
MFWKILVNITGHNLNIVKFPKSLDVISLNLWILCALFVQLGN